MGSSPQEGDPQPTDTMNLLHAGAGLHGHEFSPPAAPSSRPPRIPLRSYNSSPAPSSRPSSYQDTTKTTSTYIRPARRLSNSRRRTITDRVSFLDNPIDIRNMSTNIPSDSSDDGMSVMSRDSEFTANSASRPRKRMVKHPETRYCLAGPAPTMTQKQRLIHIRPRMVLQMQRVPSQGRPVPVLDVKSSSSFVPRIAKKFPALYKGSGLLGTNDVMICKSENYDDGDTADEDDAAQICGTKSYDEKEVIAVICQAPKDSGYSGELCFDDGSRWTMAPGRGRSFELTKTDNNTGETTVGRWVAAGTSRRTSFQTPITKLAKGGAETAKLASDQKYNFSLVDPSKRRHPIMATLKQTGLAIKDTYSPCDQTPSSSAVALDAEATSTPENEDPTYEDPSSPSYPTLEPQPIRTTEEQKLLIEISSIWLASRLGWCPWPDASHASPSPPSSSKPAGSRQRSSTLTPSGSAKHKRQRSGTVGSIAESPEDYNDEKDGKGSVPKRSGIFKRSSLTNPVFHNSDSEQSPPRSVPRRSVSTGAAFMQKVAEKRASETGSRSGSTTASRNNSRPSSPRRACSVDMLSGMGGGNKHSEALTSRLRGVEAKRNSLPSSPVIRRTQSDFSAMSTLAGPETSPHLKIGEEVIGGVTTNPLLNGQAKTGRRESAYGAKKEALEDGVPTRSKSVPSKKSKASKTSQSQPVDPKKKVSKMKVFLGIFSRSQRRKNEEVEKGVWN